MTCSSRNFLISWGTGRVDLYVRPSTRRSSAMMSLQTSTHSSQMKTVGPAMSLRTSFWSLLQNEHLRTSDSPPFFICLDCASSLVLPRSISPLAAADHVVHDTI